LQVQAALVQGAFVVIALVFVSLGFYWRKQLAGNMEAELAEKSRVNRELERSNRDLQQFAYVAGHDLQEPLRTVARFTQLLERRYADKLDDDAREFMGYTVDGAKRMQALIEGLLELSRVDTRGRPLAPTAMERVTDRAIRSLAARIADTGGTVTREWLPRVLGDEMQLGQLMQNLIGNALKFRHPDRPPTVHVSARRDGRAWIISVADNGIGIEGRHFERIFIVFQRLHAADKYDGTGMGLAVCKKIVERHGGDIWVESVPGEGATFHVRLIDADAPTE
jgi:light-regulated signal transduction histidine kinase (bacteriophytochrome)